MELRGCVKLLTTVVMVLTLTSSGEGKRNYRIEIEDASGNSSEYVTFNRFRVERFNMTQKVISVAFTVLKDFPPDLQLDAAAYEKLPSGRYSNLATKFPSGKFCKIIEDDKFFVQDIANSGNFPSRCPLLAGDYHVNNYVINCERLPAILPGTRWRFDVNMSLKKQPVMFFQAFAFIDRF